MVNFNQVQKRLALSQWKFLEFLDFSGNNLYKVRRKEFYLQNTYVSAEAISAHFDPNNNKIISVVAPKYVSHNNAIHMIYEHLGPNTEIRLG